MEGLQAFVEKSFEGHEESFSSRPSSTISPSTSAVRGRPLASIQKCSAWLSLLGTPSSSYTASSGSMSSQRKGRIAISTSIAPAALPPGLCRSRPGSAIGQLVVCPRTLNSPPLFSVQLSESRTVRGDDGKLADQGHKPLPLTPRKRNEESCSTDEPNAKRAKTDDKG